MSAFARLTSTFLRSTRASALTGIRRQALPKLEETAARPVERAAAAHSAKPVKIQKNMYMEMDGPAARH